MDQLSTFIRPSARIIRTVGDDLIGDPYAAVIELVKNSYDADASKVNVIFDFSPKARKVKITIQDDGHGMSKTVVLGKWLVPGTDDKLVRSKSPAGRPLQGRKGIGRFAASLLGSELILKTIDEEGEKTEIYIDWSIFNSSSYLDEVEILVESATTNESKGTELTIFAEGEYHDQWGKKELMLLTKELRKLKSPIQTRKDDDFQIHLSFLNSPYDEFSSDIEIESFPIIELFDYRISGTIKNNGQLDALYENNYEENLPSEIIRHEFAKTSTPIPGTVHFDIRAFDRDADAIGNLIDKGLVDPISKLALGKTETRRLLDEVYGISVYRGEFRIRPYGNSGYDWLALDNRRIQNPSLRLSNNQVVGFITIESEELSRLEEKSARDGLKENDSYFRLVDLLQTIIAYLEQRRFVYRKRTGKGRKGNRIQEELNSLFNYTELTADISSRLKRINLEDEVIDEILEVIQKEAIKKEQLLKNIERTIAIYQGQATLGKIVTVLLHEGRKPIGYFRQQAPNLSKWLKSYRKDGDWDNELYDKLLDRLSNFKQHSDLLSLLFKRLDPLAKQSRGKRKDFAVINALKKSAEVFESVLDDHQINVEIHCDEEITLFGWEDDLIIAVTNLIENSIYWIGILNEEGQETEKKDDRIEIVVSRENSEVIIHYRDTGPGIAEEVIKSGAIFEPGYSKKLEGTGLGLPISGEAIDRLNGNIIAHYSTEGAYFTIEIKQQQDE